MGATRIIPCPMVRLSTWSEPMDASGHVQIISFPPAQKTAGKGASSSSGTGKVSSLLSSLGLSSGKSSGSGPKEHTIFSSYAHKDTAGETAKLAEKAAARFPGKSIFRDADTAFRLDELVPHLNMAKNIIILLSGNYARSAYSLIELHNALKSKANVITFKVERAGMVPFDIAKIAEDIKAENFNTYLDEAGWKLLAAHGVSPKQAAENLKRLSNIRALDFSFNFALAVQDAMIEEIFKAVKQ